MSLGDRLRKLREQKGLTQTEFAARLKIPNQNVSNYERGFRQPDYETLQRFADYFEVTTDYLLGREDKKSANEEYDFETWLNDPKVSKFYKEFNESPEERREALMAVWEILKKQGKY